MNERRRLWDKAENLLVRLQDVKSPLQNEYKFTKDECLEFGTIYFSLSDEFEMLVNDIQCYMENNKV